MDQPVDLRTVILEAVEVSLSLAGKAYGLSLSELTAVCKALGRGPGMVPTTLDQLVRSGNLARSGERFVFSPGHHLGAALFMFSFEDDYRDPVALDFPLDHLWERQEKLGPQGAKDTWGNIVAAGTAKGIASHDLEVSRVLLSLSGDEWIKADGDMIQPGRNMPQARPSKLIEHTAQHRARRPFFKQLQPIIQQVIAEREQHPIMRTMTRVSTAAWRMTAVDGT